MMKYLLNPTLLKPLIVNSSGDIFVSEKIISTIQNSISSPAPELKTKLNTLKKQYEEQRNRLRIKIDYDDPVLLDAYIINYLPRNTLIPKLGLLCCSYHSAVLPNQSRLNILDIGSGTGAIPLGLLDLFQNSSLSHIKCDIYAIDSSESALAKQKKLIKIFGLDGSTHDYEFANLEDPDTYKKQLKDKQPFDIIFCSSVLSEMSSQYIENILAIIQDNLKKDGVCIIAESQNTPAKKACAYLSHHVNDYGLHIFYPCPPGIDCTNTHCWKWFNHYFECDDILIGNEQFEVTKKHTIFWRIIIKRPLSIYQYFKANKKNLNWGITCYAKNRTCNEFCTEEGQYYGTIIPQLEYHGLEGPWSQNIGVSSDNEQIRGQWNPINEFESCNSEIKKKV